MQQLKDFEIINKLGEGSFGQVFKVRRKLDKQMYVMKQINISKMNQRMKNDALNEVTILSKLDNQYIVKYYDSFIDKQVLCIIMEYCDSGDLQRYLKGQLGRPLTENMVWKFLIQICLGITYLHKSKILHRDIKSMNIFLCKEQMVRIGDLGVAKVLSDQNNFAKTMVGTPYYLSPEMCEEKPYNEKSDVWALGCVLYELCTLKYPFEANNQGALILKIIRGKYEPISDKIYSQGLIKLIDSCLQKDYQLRPTAYDLLQQQSLIQSAKTQQISLALQQPHPQSVNYRPSQVEQKVLPEKAKILNHQSTEAQKPLSKVVVQVVQNIPKPHIEPQIKPQQLIKDKQPPQNETPYVQKKEDSTPSYVNKKDALQSALAPRQPIKSSGFNLIKMNNLPSPSPVQSKGLDYQNMYQDWKDKVNDIQSKPFKQDQIQTVNNKQQIQPTKKPISQKIQVALPQTTPVAVKLKSQEYKSEQVNETNSKPKLPDQKQELNQDKKRIRKGAPQDLSRKAQQAGNAKPLAFQQNKQSEQQDGDAAREKLKLLKDKKANHRYSNAQQANKIDIDEVVNLPDKVRANRKSVDIKQINQPIQQSETNIEDFFDSHIEKIRQEQKQQEAKQTQVKSDSSSELDEEEESKQNGNEIPIMENEEMDEQFDQQEEEEEVYEQELIMFDEDDNSNEPEQNGDLDQESYYEEQKCDDDDNDYVEDTRDSEDHQANQTGIVRSQTNSYYLENFNQFNTIKEDPHEYEQTLQYRRAEDNEQQEEEQDYMTELVIDTATLELNKKLLDKEKRKIELQMLMQSKIKECVRELGQNKFDDIIQFFRKKLNSEDDLNEQDQEEIDDVIQNKFSQKNPQIIYIIYKILHFEIEMDKCNEKISELHKELEQQ